MEATQISDEGTSSVPKKNFKTLIFPLKVILSITLVIGMVIVVVAFLAFALRMVYIFCHILYQFWYVGGAGSYNITWLDFNYFPEREVALDGEISLYVLGQVMTGVAGVLVLVLFVVFHIVRTRRRVQRFMEQEKKEAEKHQSELNQSYADGRLKGVEAARAQVYVALIHAYQPRTQLLPPVAGGCTRLFFIYLRQNARLCLPTEDTKIYYLDWHGGDLPHFIGAPMYKVVQVPREEPDRLTFMGVEYTLCLQPSGSFQVEYIA